MIQLPRITFLDYDARRDPKTNHFCIRCQRDFKPDQPRRWVRLICGGAWVLHPEDDAAYVPDGGDTGFHEIGADCARKIGIEYTWSPEAFAGLGPARVDTPVAGS